MVKNNIDLISEKRLNEILTGLCTLRPILVVGDVGIDKYTYGEVKRISPEAPVPVLEVKKEWLKLGLAANISHNLQTLGVKSTLSGVIGEDRNASLFENLLEESDLNTWGLIRSKQRPTIFKERVTTSTQQICRIDYESDEYITKDIEDKFFQRIVDFENEHSGLILEDYAKGTLTEGLTVEIIKHFKKVGKMIAVDPGRSTPPHFYKGATLLKPNLVESRQMVKSLGFDEKSSVEAMAKILMEELEIEKVVITLGPDGMAMIDSKNNSKLKVIPTLATEVFDVSGAGDTAISLLTSCLLSGTTLEEAIWLSNIGSGVVVGKKGTATVSPEEIKAFYKRVQEGFEK